VVVNRQNTQQLPIPQGYRPVWDDDRLNPQRSEQSLAGNAQMKLICTQTVPLRLINTADGRDVTASTPLVYPYLDVATQTRNLGTVSIVRRDNGQLVKRILRNRASAKVRAPVISSRSAPAVQPKPVAATSQYVQVGTYNQQGSAQTVAKRIQRMGLPVRIGKYTRGGATYRMVIAGPFGSNINGVLSKLRASGYHNASLR
jgi:cell division protein FtsN